MAKKDIRITSGSLIYWPGYLASLHNGPIDEAYHKLCQLFPELPAWAVQSLVQRDYQTGEGALDGIIIIRHRDSQ